MRIVLVLIVLLGSAFAQYQQYPKFYASPSETWNIDKLDTAIHRPSLIDTVGETISFSFRFSDREDRLESSKYKFISGRLHSKSFTFSYRGDIDSTFTLAEKHNKGIQFLYTTTPQRFIVIDSGYIWKDYSNTDIIKFLKQGKRYVSRFNLSNQDAIELNVQFVEDIHRLFVDLIFYSREYMREIYPE